MAIEYPVSQDFNPPTEPGRDYETPVGTPIYAPISGFLQTGDMGASGWGKYVKVNTGNGYYGAGHLSSYGNFKNGDFVNSGQVIGYTGNSGNSTGPHVEIFIQNAAGAFQNPANFSGMLQNWFHPTYGVASSATGQMLSTGQPGQQKSLWTITLPGLFGNIQINMDPVIGVFAVGAGGFLMLAGIAILVALALKETGAGREATHALGYAGAPLQAVVVAEQNRRQTQQTRQKESASTATRSKRDEQQTAIRAANVRTARARARVNESKARSSRGGSPRTVGGSAAAKFKAGKMSDFTPQEIEYVRSNPESFKKDVA